MWVSSHPHENPANVLFPHNKPNLQPLRNLIADCSVQTRLFNIFPVKTIREDQS